MTQGQPAIRVATYNIHHGAGPDDVLDLEHTARVIAALDADLIGLQEVDRHWSARSDLVDEPSWLAHRLGMHVVFGPAIDRDPARTGGERRQYGSAILSRFPVTSWSNSYLPRYGRSEQRCLLVADVTVRGRAVRFATTHLQYLNAAEREAQATTIVDLLGASSSRTILTGDLNGRPAARGVTTLTSAFVDSWAAVGKGDGPTFSSTRPRTRIDYVLATSDLTPCRARVVSADASDHLPVLVELALPG